MRNGETIPVKSVYGNVLRSESNRHKSLLLFSILASPVLSHSKFNAKIKPFLNVKFAFNVNAPKLRWKYVKLPYITLSL